MKNIEVYGFVSISESEELPKMEASLLLYLETCLTDQYGRVEGRRINSPEIDILGRWTMSEFISFGSLSDEAIERLSGIPKKVYTHYIRFSDSAWKIAHELRRERSDRMIGKRNEELLREFA
jgi:hypothetical protein